MRKSVSSSRSPSPPRPLSDSQRDELVTLRQKCEELEKQLQNERRLVIDKAVCFSHTEEWILPCKGLHVAFKNIKNNKPLIRHY